MIKDIFLTLFFGSFAIINYQVLQTLHQAHRWAFTRKTNGGDAKVGG